MTILLVDDKPHKMEDVCIRLSAILHHQVEIASGREEALAKISNDTGLVFIDQEMPEVTGLELGRQISKMKEYRHIPLVMLTGHDDTEYAVPALTSCGFSYFISKPNFAGERIDDCLSKIETLPAVIRQRGMKNMMDDIVFLSKQLNDERKRDYIKNADSYLKNENQKALALLRTRLDLQEQILKMTEDNESLSANMYNVSAGIILMEKNREITPEDLRQLSELKNHKSMFGLPDEVNKNSFNTLKIYFKAKENNLLTPKALIVMSLISKENRWPITVKHARGRQKNPSKFYTLIDEIVFALYEVR